MDPSLFDLSGKVAIVTGGGQGIGKGICLVLANAGADLAVVDKNPATAESTAEEVRALGRRALVVTTDVCKRDQVENMVAQILNEFGTIDILVNNAGGADPGQMVPAMEMTEDTWDAIVDLNLKSVFLCTQAVGKVMIERKKGSIVNIASIAGIVPYSTGIHYGAAKAGVINLTLTMAEVLGPHNVRINAIAPGFIVTEFTTNMTYGPHPELGELRRKAVPLGRLGTPPDIGWVAAFLASDASYYIDGQTVRVDGALPTMSGLTL